MTSLLKPKHLCRGDKVAVVSLSSGILGDAPFLHKYRIAKERLERDYGLEVVAMPNALKGSDYLYLHPEARAQDLMDAFRDPSIKAVISAIGGDDTVRLLPYIDYDVLRQNPKIFTGFSDTTTNHFMLHKAGLVSYYGLSLMTCLSEYVSINEYTRESMEKVLFYPQNTLDIPCSAFYALETDRVDWCEANMTTPRPRFPNGGYEILQGHGTVSGELLGGCSDVFPQFVGTEIWPTKEEWQGKLLLLETSEVNMSDDQLTWILRGLQANGVLHAINGIVFGKPAFPEKYESYKDVLRRVVGTEAGRPELPILYNANVGHAYPIALLPLGLRYEIDCDKKTLRLTERATE